MGFLLSFCCWIYCARVLLHRTYMADKGQDYIVHFSAVDGPRYYDAVDVRLHPDTVPDDKVYGRPSRASKGWLKTDHCQVTNPSKVVGHIRDATHNVVACAKDATAKDGRSGLEKFQRVAINVVPSTNPDVVPRFTTRNVELVDPLCKQACVVDPVLDPGDNTVFTSGMFNQSHPPFHNGKVWHTFAFACSLAWVQAAREIVLAITMKTELTTICHLFHYPVKGMCRKKAAQGGAVCAAATPTHHIKWANPAVSGSVYVEKAR